MRSLHVYERLTDHACRLRIDLPAGKNNGRNIIVIAMHSNGVAANTQVRCMFSKLVKIKKGAPACLHYYYYHNCNLRIPYCLC